MYWNTQTLLDTLIGKVVTRATYNDGLYLTTEDNQVIGIGVEGDCCSYSWFSDFTGFENLIGHRVLQMEDVEYTDCPNAIPLKEDEHDCLEFYCIGIRTEAGLAKIYYINDSNGYYGGYLTSLGISNAPSVGIEITTEYHQ